MKTKIKMLVTSIMFLSSLMLLWACDKSIKKVKDVDGNVYDVVQIGEQCWMKQNLRVSHYNDSTEIPTNQTVADWENGKVGAYAIYQDEKYPNKVRNNAKYGKLYNWYAVNTGKLAPKGWHVATDADWYKLDIYLGHSNAGIKLKTRHSWQKDPIGIGTDETGFSALPGGSQSYGGMGYSWFMGQYAQFWTSKSMGLCPNDNNTYPISYAMSYNVSNITPQLCYRPNFGMSVRCVKD